MLWQLLPAATSLPAAILKANRYNCKHQQAVRQREYFHCLAQEQHQLLVGLCFSDMFIWRNSCWDIQTLYRHLGTYFPLSKCLLFYLPTYLESCYTYADIWQILRSRFYEIPDKLGRVNTAKDRKYYSNIYWNWKQGNKKRLYLWHLKSPNVSTHRCFVVLKCTYAHSDI